MTSKKQKPTGKTTGKHAASVPYRAADFLNDEQEIAAYLEAILEDGDPRVITLGLRHVADAVGGMSELAKRTGLTREALYRTLSSKGNPRLSTLTAILQAFNLRLSVVPDSKQAA